jgi:hypothetical protein
MALAFSAEAAPPKPKPKPAVVDSAVIYQAQADSINGTFTYQQGPIVLPGGLGEFTAPIKRFFGFGTKEE